MFMDDGVWKMFIWSLILIGAAGGLVVAGALWWIFG